jgi:hypothetical protein
MLLKTTTVGIVNERDDQEYVDCRQVSVVQEACSSQQEKKSWVR